MAYALHCSERIASIVNWKVPSTLALALSADETLLGHTGAISPPALRLRESRSRDEQVDTRRTRAHIVGHFKRQ